ncbi:hypothetical protein JTE90_015665 [Oedothorax gibbosus]|uniref:Tubulin--tyrosine ligase-like protein 12 SET-like domain-containing protein n=1 Tax=Oedothorax gibbosus TaxID=931172 RepID=A0AAV6UFT2_9ARAC|nr:hypothetical protein JTE90_015665 [Oedothorax gibbosus]
MLNGEVDHYNLFVSAHEAQLKSLALAETKWKTLFTKLRDSVIDAGNDFMFSEGEESEEGTESSLNSDLKVFTKCAMDPEDEDHIYLIDHAWTYTLESAKSVLSENLSLIQRMAAIMNITFEGRPQEEVINDIQKEMWKYNNSYILQNTSRDQTSTVSPFTRCWFIMDEFGSKIRRSEDPSFSVVPFFYVGENMMYSLLFPTTSVNEGAEVTCAYPRYRSNLEDNMKKALKFPWEPFDLSSIDYTQSEPDLDYFMSGRGIEILPEDIHELPNLVEKQEIKLYTEYPEVAEHLTNPQFVVTDSKDEAHVLWLAERLYNYKELADTKGELFYVSQFPSEQILINKELMSIACRRAGTELSFCDQALVEFNPKWLPTTYSLMIELPQFISYFQNREKRNLDNTWICKPFNMARGMDIYICDNINQIIRLSEVRPMVACKYLTDPVLFPKDNVGLVKMDFRFIVLLKSIQDFELFVYERFWLRFANKPFSLGDFEDYEKHFTVMNYGDFQLEQMYCHDFIKKFEDHYPEYKWCEIEESIYKMIKEVFIASAMKESPAGIGTFPGSRAMYGLDIMLQWDRSHDKPKMSPVLIEVNWMPDCKRACDYYPEFYDDVFSVLFLNKVKGKHVVQL